METQGMQMTRDASSTKLDNPVGLDGMEFIEYATPEPQKLEKLFAQLGFKKMGEMYPG